MIKFGIIVLFISAGSSAPTPEFLEYNPKTGEFSVNYAGYHAGVGGLGGSADGNGDVRNLYANAGTPHGQNAFAGLGGRFGNSGFGGLFAGASGAPGLTAGAGLGGGYKNGGVYGDIFSGAQPWQDWIAAHKGDSTSISP